MQADGLRLYPQILGNAQGGLAHAGGQNAAAAQPEVYRAPPPLRCVSSLMLLSCLCLLRTLEDSEQWQRDYAEVMRGQGESLAAAVTFPWDLNLLAVANDTFEATFLWAEEDTSAGRPSNFLHLPQLGPGMVVVGAGNVVLPGHGPGASLSPTASVVATTSASATPAGLSGLEALTSAPGSPDLPGCGREAGRPGCFVGVQKTRSRNGSTCHRFVSGSVPHNMRHLHDGHSNRSAFCVHSKQVKAVVPTRGGSAVITWSDTRFLSKRPDRSTCVAVMDLLPDMRMRRVFRASSVSTILFDNSSSSLITIGFSAPQVMVVVQYDAMLLELVSTYTLPLSVAWLLREPRLTDGVLLFLGPEESLVSTTFIVDLVNFEVYQEEPPLVGSRKQKPVRRRMPHVVQRFDASPASDIAPPPEAMHRTSAWPQTSAGQQGVAKDGSQRACRMRTCKANDLETCFMSPGRQTEFHRP